MEDGDGCGGWRLRGETQRVDCLVGVAADRGREAGAGEEGQGEAVESHCGVFLGLVGWWLGRYGLFCW